MGQQTKMRRRVVITGMGAVTPLGHSVAELYQNQLEGKSGVGPITLFDASTFPTKFAAEVKNLDLGRYFPHPEQWASSGANTHFVLVASQQALKDAGLLDHSKIDPGRCGTYLGAGEGIQDFNHLVTLVAQSYHADKNQVDAAVFTAGGLREFHPL